MNTNNTLQFNAPGPVCSAFLADRSNVSAIMGPMGSAKTSTVIMKFLRLAAEQAPSPVDGVRYTKVGVVRETTTNMKRTTIKSAKNWFGGKGRWFGGGGSMEPLSCQVKLSLGDGTIADLVFEFIGLDGNNIEDLAKGWEITHYWLNEGDLVEESVKDWLDGRIGRYPSKIHGGASFYCGILDYNAPDTENYLYHLFEVTRPDNHRLFKQPGGRSPHAENLHNLPLGYYERMAAGKESWWVRRNVDNIYGFSRDGFPVFEEYNDDLHCGGSVIAPVPGLPIIGYADAALHPGMVFVQRLGSGQVLLLDELYLYGGAVQLGIAALEKLGRDYPGFKFVGGLVDPAAGKNAEHDIEADNWIDTLSRTMNLQGRDRFRPAPTNDPVKRHDAVRELLTTLLDAGKPALLVSAKASVARKGFNASYRFKKRKNGEREDKPEKTHPVSDVHDAIQYCALDDGGYEMVSAKQGRARAARDFSKMRTAKVEVRV